MFKYIEAAGYETLKSFPPSSIEKELGILGYRYTNVVGAAVNPKGAYLEMGVRKHMLRESVESGDCSSTKVHNCTLCTFCIA